MESPVCKESLHTATNGKRYRQSRGWIDTDTDAGSLPGDLEGSGNVAIFAVPSEDKPRRGLQISVLWRKESDVWLSTESGP